MTSSPMPPWAAEIPEGAFISDSPTYKVGEYFSLFEKDTFDSGASVGSLKYWFYDPTEHGYPAKGDYPLIIFLHGSGNALVGDVCINYTGAEFFATDAYQKKLGGAYLLVPVANEYRNEEGRTCREWREISDDSESKQERMQYMLNAYRVLLTRARVGMIICVPTGNVNINVNGFPEDSTRLPEYYDGTYNYFKSLGLEEI